MKKVRCISPHGGCHNGMTTRGDPVFPLPNGDLPEIPAEDLHLPPNPGGYIDDTRIPGRFAAVGHVYDVPDDFVADGFHWEDVPEPAPAPQPVPDRPAKGA